MERITVLNFGAGINSCALYAMMEAGDVPPADVCIFSDLEDEPAFIYEQLEFMKSLAGPPIVVIKPGCLGDNLIQGVNSSGGRFVSIPAFLSANDDGKNTGIGRRQCTREYKIGPIESAIRNMIGLEPGERMPSDIEVHQIIGLCFDEPKRVARVRGRFEGRKQWSCGMPLFEEFVRHSECIDYLSKRFPGRTFRSSRCVFCPFQDDAEWLDLKEHDPRGFARAVQIDKAIREPSSACTAGLNAAQYLHRSCKPLDEVEFKPKDPSRQGKLIFHDFDCDGACGS